MTDEEAWARFDNEECLHCAVPFSDPPRPVESARIWCARCQQAAQVRGAQQGSKPWPRRSVYRGADVTAYLGNLLALFSQGAAA